MEFLIARVGVSKPEINLQWRKFTHQLAVHRTCSFYFSFHLDSKLSEKKILILINAVKSWPVSVEKGGLYFHEPARDILPCFIPQMRVLTVFTFSWTSPLIISVATSTVP